MFFLKYEKKALGKTPEENQGVFELKKKFQKKLHIFSCLKKNKTMSDKLQLTHAFSNCLGKTVKFDIRPEAIAHSNLKDDATFKGKSSGDNAVLDDGRFIILLGVDKKGEILFTDQEQKYFVQIPTAGIFFLATPKTEIKWCQEPKPQPKTNISKKRKNVEIEVESDEEIGEIKFVKKIAKSDEK